MKILTHETLGRYQVEAEIGRGAMGVVYRARDPKIDRLVAIKTISLAGQEPEDEQDYRERFLQEARAAGRLSHPGIVTIYDAGEQPETREPYLVMEYVSGQSLNRLLFAADGKLPVETALQFVIEIAEALDYAHSQGVIHRDIKPANILITEDGHAKIADFGVARLNQTLTTHTGQIFGSPAYMAPEQLTRGHADARSDLFSVGVMLYSMITGFRPFQGNSAETVCFKLMNVEPVPVTSFQAEVHPRLDRIVARAIAKEPDERFQTGSELARDLREFLTSINGDVPTPGPLPLWATQTTRDLQLHNSADYFKHFSWQVGIAVLAIAAALTAWQINKDIRAAASIQPPAPPHLPSAPQILKASLLRVIHHRPHLAAKKSEPQSAAVPIDMAYMHLEILHHFPAAKVSVLLDEKVVFDETLHIDNQRHTILRALEMEHTAKFDVASGKHQMQVHVVTPDGSYDQTETLEADLISGSKHVLRVNCDKKKMQVTLE